MTLSQEEIYQILYRAWKVEYSSIEIRHVENSECFLKDIQGVFQSLKIQYDSEQDKTAKLILQKTIGNMEYLFNDLLEIRAKKILNFTQDLKKIDENILFDFEIEYYRSLTTSFKGYFKIKKTITSSDLINISPSSPSELHQIPPPLKDLQLIAIKSELNTKSTDIETNSQIQLNKKEEKMVQDKNQLIQIMPLKSNEPNQINKEDENIKKVELINKNPNVKNDTINAKPLTSDNQFEKSLISNKVENYSTIRILKNIPALVGEDLGIYGPFNEEDIIFIPKRNAEILLEEKVAKLLNE